MDWAILLTSIGVSITAIAALVGVFVTNKSQENQKAMELYYKSKETAYFNFLRLLPAVIMPKEVSWETKSEFTSAVFAVEIVSSIDTAEIVGKLISLTAQLNYAYVNKHDVNQVQMAVDLLSQQSDLAIRALNDELSQYGAKLVKSRKRRSKKKARKLK